MGLYPPRTGLWSSNHSAISQRDWGFLTVQGGVDPRKLGLLPRLVEVLEMWNDFGTGDGTGSTYEPWLIRKSASGVGISTPCPKRYQPG